MTTSQHVRRLFALPNRKRRLVPIAPSIIQQAVPEPGQITLLVGPSGGGKSRLLRAIRETYLGRSIQWIDPTHIELAELSVVDCVCNVLDDDTDTSTQFSKPQGSSAQSSIAQSASAQNSIEHALELLSRVGLAEAWTYLQRPGELSDGQRWRLLLAMAVAKSLRTRRPESVAVIAMDEFAALLDRVTARIVARALRRLVDRQVGSNGHAMGAIVATSHHDLAAALQPETIITCDFGDYVIDARSSRNTRAI